MELNIQSDLTSLRGKLAESIADDEKQRDFIAERIGKNRVLLNAINGSLGILTKEATGYGATAEMIRSAIRAMTEPQFTSVQVDEQVMLMFPTATISKGAIRTALWNMVRNEEIEPLRKGTNRMPALYQKKPVQTELVIGDSGSRTNGSHKRNNLSATNGNHGTSEKADAPAKRA